MSIFGVGGPKLLSAVRGFLESDDWKFSQIEGETALRFGFTGKNGSWSCFVKTYEDKEQFVFYSVLPNNVPEGKRPAVAEYLTRVNYRMVLGNFEMDFNDGQVLFKISVDVEGGSLAPTMIKNIIYTNVLMVDKYLPGLNKVMYGNATPAAAVQEIEK